jgi:hypothetical protein
MYKVEIACAGILSENTSQRQISHGLLIFDGVIPLELRKKNQIFSFRSLTI